MHLSVSSFVFSQYSQLLFVLCQTFALLVFITLWTEENKTDKVMCTCLISNLKCLIYEAVLLVFVFLWHNMQLSRKPVSRRSLFLNSENGRTNYKVLNNHIVHHGFQHIQTEGAICGGYWFWSCLSVFVLCQFQLK